jgi:ABC-type branched-subunit amino acid transport system substrate-binding protein
MKHHPLRIRITLGLVLVLLVGILAGHFTNAFDPSEGNRPNEVRIAARPLADGRTEVALQQRMGSEWGEYITPDARFLPPDANVDRWHHSSPITVAEPQVGPGPLKIALLQTVHGAAAERRQAFKLAIAQLNAAGGIFGRPVIGLIADFNLDQEFIVASAKRLVEEEGVHAFVGPTFSSSSLVISEHVSNPLQIPTISPSATSPDLTAADPGDWFFRTTPSDAAGQGAILARLAKEQGHNRVGVLYRDDAYGRGLADEVVREFGGDALALPIDHVAGVTFLSEIEQVAASGATGLIVLGCWKESATIISESLAGDLFDDFLLADCGQSRSLFDALGPEIAQTLIGTSPTFGAETDSTRFFNQSYERMWGEPPQANVTFVPGVYDATIALALAAHAAQSTDGPAIRDQLRQISNGEGLTFGAAELSQALKALADGQHIDYQGAVSSLDWDDNGDLTRFTIGIWRFTADGEIEVVRRIPVDLEP